MQHAAPHITEISCASGMHKLKRAFPYGWDVNPYKGCTHGCIYCYALYSHPEILAQKAASKTADTRVEPRCAAEIFSGEIYVKTNIVERLERELSAPGWRREVVNLGGVTDCYQVTEGRYSLMPDILRLLVKYRTPAIISTKSTLLLRDFDLIEQLARITYINIASTITTMDESLRAIIEPGASSSAARLAMLREFRKTNASVGLHAMPILPFVSDSRENIEGLFAGARDAGVHYLLPGTLYLRGQTKPEFMSAIKRFFPEKVASIQALYHAGSAGTAYKNNLYATVNELRNAYGVSSSWAAPMKERLKETKPLQPELF